jgi:hypothetical protein
MSTAVNPSSDENASGRGRDENTTGRGRDENATGRGRDDVKTSPTSSDDTAPLGRREVVARQKEQFGGMKFGSAFFGWLAATGMGVLLTALVTGAGAAIGLGRTGPLPDPNTANVETVGLVGGIVVVVVIFLAYFGGGYVAGRMARFNGIKQGIAVWIWAIIIAIVVAVIGAVAGSQFDLLANLNGFPRIPVNEGALTTGGVITAVGVAVVSLVGAIFGGLAGMRFHRRVDKAGLD